MSIGSSGNVDPVRAAETRAPQILIVSTVISVIAFIFVCLRSYTRFFIVRSYGPQDAFMVISVLTSLLGGTVTLYLQAPLGLGKHRDTIEGPDLVKFMRLSFVQTIVPLIGGIAFLKIAIALELRKLRSNAWAWYEYLLWAMIVFVTLYSIEAWLTIFLFCKPLPRYWDSSIQGKCYSLSLFAKFGLANTAFNIFTDVAFATLPVPIIWTLKMPVKTRLYLIGVLSLGYVAVVIGILKAVAQINFTSNKDSTFTYEIQFWGLLQLNLGIIAACAPALKPLVRNILNLKSLTPGYGYTNSASRRLRSGKRTTGLSNKAKGYIRQTSKTGGPEAFELKSVNDNQTFYIATAEGRNDSDLSGPGGNGTRRENSSDSIVHPDANGKNIVRTTEVSVTY
ncbi:unnamed protein product [Clonostachys rosea]|uniref:Rhodopsin domain-containing protein n=1 Tax=Bionectria ochroleuca TaxID=29856 RepID=A0ABY6UBE8_BIOOC|nr:unnamed protein product [Clonostachys rosea]